MHKKKFHSVDFILEEKAIHKNIHLLTVPVVGDYIELLGSYGICLVTKRKLNLSNDRWTIWVKHE